MDPAPAFEESPDLSSALSILHAAVPGGVVRPTQPIVMVRRRANARIHGPTRTEPSPQGPLPRQRANAIVHNSRCFTFTLCRVFLLNVQGYAATFSGGVVACFSRNRGGGPPIV